MQFANCCHNIRIFSLIITKKQKIKSNAFDLKKSQIKQKVSNCLPEDLSNNDEKWFIVNKRHSLIYPWMQPKCNSARKSYQYFPVILIYHSKCKRRTLPNLVIWRSIYLKLKCLTIFVINFCNTVFHQIFVIKMLF